MFRRRRRPLAAASAGHTRPDGSDVVAHQRTDVESDDRPDDRADNRPDDSAHNRADDFAHDHANANANADTRWFGDHVQPEQRPSRSSKIGMLANDGHIRR